MGKWIGRLWKDEDGFIISAELILVATIAILSMVVGLSVLSRAVNGELIDVANGFGSLNQSGRYGAFSSNQSQNLNSNQNQNAGAALLAADIAGEAGQ